MPLGAVRSFLGIGDGAEATETVGESARPRLAPKDADRHNEK